MRELAIGILCGIGIGLALSSDTAPAPPPTHAAQLVVFFVPTTCELPCGSRMMYLLWDDGSVEQRLCSGFPGTCTPWETLP